MTESGKYHDKIHLTFSKIPAYYLLFIYLKVFKANASATLLRSPRRVVVRNQKSKILHGRIIIYFLRPASMFNSNKTHTLAIP